ncbi:class I SAM-dependent methyltransferase [Streptomyces sp. NPDC127098]|uniref:class I SAM-dependent methyltransferase n=1 Tax=Streptomyces sp. NPDC127098 TaxID=3347137 RepID=UPI00365A4ECB
MTDHVDHVARNRHYWDETAAGYHGPLARDHWARTEPRWGLWGTPESQVRILPPDLPGTRVVELGCGTAYVSAWLARAGAHPVGVDVSEAQLATARAMQAEFGLDFPLVQGSAEDVPYPDDSFDLAISEFGASLWCDPDRWIPEAARLLRPGGRLVFSRYAPLYALTVSPEEHRATDTLHRPHFGGLGRIDLGDRVEFVSSHGEMVRTLRASGFTVDDLIEIQAPAPAHREFDEVSSEWAHRWPSEEIWKATLTG